MKKFSTRLRHFAETSHKFIFRGAPEGPSAEPESNAVEKKRVAAYLTKDGLDDFKNNFDSETQTVNMNAINDIESQFDEIDINKSDTVDIRPEDETFNLLDKNNDGRLYGYEISKENISDVAKKAEQKILREAAHDTAKNPEFRKLIEEKNEVLSYFLESYPQMKSHFKGKEGILGTSKYMLNQVNRLRGSSQPKSFTDCLDSLSLLYKKQWNMHAENVNANYGVSLKPVSINTRESQSYDNIRGRVDAHIAKKQALKNNPA